MPPSPPANLFPAYTALSRSTLGSTAVLSQEQESRSLQRGRNLPTAMGSAAQPFLHSLPHPLLRLLRKYHRRPSEGRWAPPDARTQWGMHTRFLPSLSCHSGGLQDIPRSLPPRPHRKPSRDHSLLLWVLRLRWRSPVCRQKGKVPVIYLFLKRPWATASL